ncbi:hypothetical protein [Pedobacter sp. Hv1]|uniref:hypothetical protein n=1 Tax=Pedobacter sp. Hv1 TaxID=1740090 RepID=UPI0006D8CFB5|nr:hypothetical protein [Pedobacter sp. Hv1]KQC02468.1 hypothetical protein AQF98_02505 [Pedobacter sp. Hv1]
MLRLGLFLLIFFSNTCSSYARKEYKDEIAYYKDFPNGKHDGKDGHWLKTDRIHHTGIWSIANEINLVNTNGFEQYDTIEERSDFYKWYQLKTDSLGFDTKWAGVAAITTRKLSKLLSFVPSLTGNSNKEIKAFVTYGNQLIFDDIWKDLQKLRQGKILKGSEAKDWDSNLLWREQNLINPSYLNLSHRSLNILLKSLRKESPLSKFFPGFEFEGDLLSIQDRWNYGMKMMGY